MRISKLKLTTTHKVTIGVALMVALIGAAATLGSAYLNRRVPNAAIATGPEAPSVKNDCPTAGIVDHGQSNTFNGETIIGFACGVDAQGTNGTYNTQRIIGPRDQAPAR